MDYRIYKLLSSFISSIVLMLSVLLVSCNTDDYNGIHYAIENLM